VKIFATHWKTTIYRVYAQGDLRLEVNSAYGLLTASARRSQESSTVACRLSKHKVQPSSLGERTEGPVTREERNPLIHAALGDERVTEARLAAPCQHDGSQCPGPLPISRRDLNQRNIGKRHGDAGRQLRVAEQFGKHKGAMSTCRSPSARSSKSVSWPEAPSRKATHVLVSAAITDRP